jgi:hypothetical protein
MNVLLGFSAATRVLALVTSSDFSEFVGADRVFIV